MRASSVPRLGLLLALAGCSVPPNVSPSVSPSSSPSAQESTAPEGPTAVVLGNLFDEAGTRIETGTISLFEEQGTAPLQTVSALGGSFSLGALPVGKRFRALVEAPDYTQRERVFTVQPLIDPELDPNRLDFGGKAQGWAYALTLYPDISSTEIINPTDSNSPPVQVRLKLSQSLPETERLRFGRMLTLGFQTASGFEAISVNTSFLNRTMKLAWENDRTALVTVNYPLIVSSTSNNLTVSLTPGADSSDLPLNEKGSPLGKGLVAEARSPEGVKLSQPAYAPFFRGLEATQNPPALADRTPEAWWGQTHQTGVTLKLTPIATQPKVLEVKAYRDTPTAVGRFIVTFDRPMRGYPESLNYRSPLDATNYRWIKNRIDNPGDSDNDDSDFTAASPRDEGNAITGELSFVNDTLDQIVLPVAAGVLEDASDFKLYIAPGIQDVAGNQLGTFRQSDAWGDNVIGGKVL